MGQYAIDHQKPFGVDILELNQNSLSKFRTRESTLKKHKSKKDIYFTFYAFLLLSFFFLLTFFVFFFMLTVIDVSAQTVYNEEEVYTSGKMDVNGLSESFSITNTSITSYQAKFFSQKEIREESSLTSQYKINTITI